ncbi:MAG: hypothetical protein ACE5H0_03135 [Bacteroidota bacterium]
MLRILLWVAIAYLIYRIVRRMIVGMKRYFPNKPHVHSSSPPQSSKNQIDYSKVQDANFEDIKEGKEKPS